MTALRARAEAWLLDPPTSPEVADSHPGAAGPSTSPPVFAVVGLGRGAGATTIARALAGQLARCDPSGAAILFSAAVAPRPALATGAAARLAERVCGAGCDDVRAAGRLVLIPPSEPLAPIAAERPAPIVIDIRHGDGAEPALAFADHVALVASAEVEAALIAAVQQSLRAGGTGVSLVVNRWLGGACEDGAILIAESRLAARAALACRGARGGLAGPIAELAERCPAEARR